MAGWMDEAMETLRPWIGRVRTVEDDIGLMAVRRAAGTFDMDPASFKKGSELPPHWFGLFFAETVRQNDIGPDGHPNKGIVLPPIPMPRRMGAGRRVKITGRLRAGEPALKKAEVADIVPKTGRSGDIFVLTMRHTIEQHGKTLAVDEFDAIYRPAVPPGQKTTATVPTRARTDHAWSDRTTLSNAAQLPLLRAHLECAPHPLRRRLYAQRGRLSGPGVERRPQHASHGRRRAAPRHRHASPAAPRGSSIRCGSAT